MSILIRKARKALNTKIKLLALLLLLTSVFISPAMQAGGSLAEEKVGREATVGGPSLIPLNSVAALKYISLTKSTTLLYLSINRLWSGAEESSTENHYFPLEDGSQLVRIDNTATYARFR